MLIPDCAEAWGAVVEAISAQVQELPPALRAVYQRVEPVTDYLGRPTMFTVRASPRKRSSSAWLKSSIATL